MSRIHQWGLLLALVACSVVNANDVFGKSGKGAPAIKTINVISFATGGVILIGDGGGKQIFAVETDDTKPQPPLSAPIADIDAKLGARLGTNASGIKIIDLAVNPASGKIYIAVARLADKSHAILTVNGKGQIGELDLQEATYARVGLSGGSVPISKIGDVAWADGKIVASGTTNETFASKIFSISTPFDHDQVSEVASAETYHVAHRRWETRAPMSVLIPYKEDGKSYVIGAFACTPIVKYPVHSITTGSKVKGTSVLELGSGNRPIDMFIYTKKNKTYVIANTFRFHHSRRPVGPSPYWTVKFEQSILAEEKEVNETALRRVKGGTVAPATPRVTVVESMHGAEQMDQLDDEHAVILRVTTKEVERDGKKVSVSRRSLDPVILP